MSNDIATRGSTEMSAIDEQLAAAANAMQTALKVGGSSILLKKNGKLKMPDGVERDHVDVVIIDYRYRNQLFDKAYVPGQFSESICFGVSIDQDTMVPSEECTQPQAAACAGCPKNAFGSNPNGRGGKACQNQFIMAVQMPDLGMDDVMYVLKASPTAAMAISSYILRMNQIHGHVVKVITRFSAEDVNGEYVKLKAEFLSVNDDYQAHAVNLKAAGQALETVPKNRTRAEAADAAKAAQAAQPDAGKARGGGRSRAA